MEEKTPSLRSRIYGAKGIVAVFLVAIFLWLLIPELGIVSSYRLPKLVDVITEMLQPAYVMQMEITAIEVFLGFAMGVAAGFAIGTLAAYSNEAKRLLSPISLFLSAIKKSTLAPIFVVWVGYGILPIALVTALICFFPVMVNTMDGLAIVEASHVEMMQSIQASKWHVFKKLRFPNALPKIFDGLKISATLSVVGAVVGEFLIGLQGLGTMLQIGTWLMESKIIFASVIWMSLMGLALYFIILVIERLILPTPLRRKEL